MVDKKNDRKFKKEMWLAFWKKESGDKTHVRVNASDDSKIKSLQELLVDGSIWLEIWHEEVPYNSVNQ